MSIRSVQREARTALKDRVVTADEAARIVETAEKGRVTEGEVKAVKDLFDKTRSPGMCIPPEASLEPGARATLMDFLTRNAASGGAATPEALRALLASDSDKGWKVKTAAFASYSRSAPPVFLDVTRRDDGNFDVVVALKHFLTGEVSDKKTVVVSPEGEVVDSGEREVTAATVEKLKARFAEAKADLDFKPADRGLPLGVRFERVPLEREPGFDTYSYTALVPVGALSPAAPVGDPNDADSFFIERSGGFAGITMIAGPVTFE